MSLAFSIRLLPFPIFQLLPDGAHLPHIHRNDLRFAADCEKRNTVALFLLWIDTGDGALPREQRK